MTFDPVTLGAFGLLVLGLLVLAAAVVLARWLWRYVHHDRWRLPKADAPLGQVDCATVRRHVPESGIRLITPAEQEVRRRFSDDMRARLATRSRDRARP